MIFQIQDFMVSLKVLNSKIILKTFTHVLRTCLVMRAVLESLSLIGVKCITYLFSNESCLRISIFDGCEMYHLPV